MIRVNGDPSPRSPGSTVADILSDLRLAPDAPGVAVAVDGEVVPRGSWADRQLQADARVEVLTATQGG